MANNKPKEYKCKVCGKYYTKTRSTQQVCSIQCAIKLSKKKAEVKRKKQGKEERKQQRARLDALKPQKTLLTEAQNAVNAYIRLRDNGKPCISCGVPLRIGGIGGGFDAGHYRSRGNSPHLRFYTLNIHGQCKKCNRYDGGNYSEYRKGLIERLGIEKVESIDADNRPRHYSKDDLRRIKKIFKKKVKLLMKRKGI